MPTLPTSIAAGASGHLGVHDAVDVLLNPAYSASLALGMIAQGTFAARPAAGTQGLYYYATDRGTLYYDTGAAWVAVNADSSLFVQRQNISSGSSTSLSSADTNCYTGSATLPSGWASMDLEVSGFVSLQYGNDSGFRRAIGQVKIDSVAASQLGNAFWEDIAASAVNRTHDVPLKNAASGKTGSATIDVICSMNHPGASGTPGTDHVSAVAVYLTVTKYRKT